MKTSKPSVSHTYYTILIPTYIHTHNSNPSSIYLYASLFGNCHGCLLYMVEMSCMYVCMYIRMNVCIRYIIVYVWVLFQAHFIFTIWAFRLLKKSRVAGVAVVVHALARGSRPGNSIFPSWNRLVIKNT